MGFRMEKDSLGEMAVPEDALFGAHTARALENFPLSGWTMPREFLRALVLIKKAMAIAHGELGFLPLPVAQALGRAADKLLAGELWHHFPVDVFQTGSATSTNMNANEVLARLANTLLEGEPAPGLRVHPNDHANLGQSSNDVIPTAARMVAWQTARDLLGEGERLAQSLGGLARRYGNTVTLGRTHLVDALPTTYGRVFDVWQGRIRRSLRRVEWDTQPLTELPLGGTGVGTGLNAHPQAVNRALALLREWTGAPWQLMDNPALGIACWDDLLAFATSLSHFAGVLFCLAQELRWRSSGPNGGLGELRLPAVQPGSSLMPGKVNPVIPEAVAQVCLEVQGLAQACAASQALAQLELFHAAPLVTWNLITGGRLLTSACKVLVERCLAGLSVNEERCRQLAAASPALVTALSRELGYDQAAQVALLAQREGVSLVEAGRKLGVEERLLTAVLDPARLAGALREGETALQE
ncbi:MAG: lyase family protein [Thermoanaerobaculum sp.]|nr:lyase family protein [Thermoanaerobaculum sp.]MDW7968460.1 lyase family protein [Thermoanaerobaculum sp.]